MTNAKRKADKRLRKAGDNVDQLHRARKSMKRLRYGEVASDAKHLQTYAAELGEPADAKLVLGEHQDAIVAADFLAATAPSHGAGGSAFTYEVLMANEIAEAAASGPS